MIDYLMLILGFALLTKGADYLVEGSSGLARRFRISSLAIGLTVVAFGTSMPELVVNVFASLSGNSAVPFGNILGSNIANIALILGLAAVIVPLKVQLSTVWKEIPFALLAVIVLFITSNKGAFGSSPGAEITRGDGIILLLFFAIFMYYVLGLIREKQEKSSIHIKFRSHNSLIILLMIAGGIFGLYLGGKITVEAAVSIARQIGISDLLISSTVVAVGTSLPELVTSLVAAMKKEMDLSVGNIVGSNIFNIFLIMGISAVISPLQAPYGINIDFLILGLATILLFVFMFTGSKGTIDRWEGIVFLVIYLTYLTILIKRG